MKIVFSKTLQKIEWGNSRLIKEINPEEIMKMKQEKGKDMLILGSANIVRQFTSLGLIDEYHLLVHPVVLGNGKPLFKDLTEKHNLKLLETKTFKNGVVGLFYLPASKSSEQSRLAVYNSESHYEFKNNFIIILQKRKKTKNSNKNFRELTGERSQ